MERHLVRLQVILQIKYMENKPSEETVYKSNYRVIFVGILLLFGSFFAEIYHTYDTFPHTPLAYVVFFVALSLLFSPVVYYKYNIYISLSKERLLLRYLNNFLIASDEIQLSSIDMIHRVRPSMFSGLGDSFITFYLKDGSYIRIHEAYYDVAVIKDFLTDLKTRRPWIEFDEQYLDLMEGRVLCDKSFTHITPRYTEFYTDEISDRYFL
jgi:hypothetical protein